MEFCARDGHLVLDVLLIHSFHHHRFFRSGLFEI